jgi:hypothetical protein
MFNKFLGLITCLTIGSSAYGQCRTFYPSVPVHHYSPPVIVKKEIVKEIITPVAVPVIVPAFTFQYAPPCVSAIAPAAHQAGAVAHAGAAPAPVANPGYAQGHAANPGYTTPPPASAPFAANSNDKIRDLAKALLEEMNKQGTNEDSGPPVASGPLVPPSSPLPPGNPNLPTSGVSREQFAPSAMAALQRNCAACHTGNGAKGDFVLFTQPNVFNNAVSMRSILKEVDSGRMPPRSSQYRLSLEEVNHIRGWLSGL